MLKLSPDQKKAWIESSLSLFSTLIDPHTKWVHYCHEDTAVKTTIPVFENALYLLAQLRDHHIETLQGTIHRFFDLLQYQNSDGSFPCYFHERGYGRHSTSINMILPFSIIWEHYIQLFSEDGKEKIKESFASLLSFFERIVPHSPLDLLCVQIGRSILYKERVTPSSWTDCDFRSLKEAIQYFLFMQLLPEKEIQDHLLKTLQRYWGFGFYLGPLWEERTSAGYISGCLLDMLEGKPTKDASSLMLAPLLLPDNQPKFTPHLPASVAWKEFTWHLFRHEGAFIHAIENYVKIDEVAPHYLQLLRMAFPTRDSLVLFASRCQISTSYKKGQITLFGTWQGEEKDGEELTFYLTKSPGSLWEIDGGLATTFTLKETLSFFLSGYKISLKGEIIEGSADLLGMISRGSRPTNEKKVFDGCDWMVSIRPQYRTETFVCKWTLTLEKIEEQESLKQVP